MCGGKVFSLTSCIFCMHCISYIGVLAILMKPSKCTEAGCTVHVPQVYYIFQCFLVLVYAKENAV